MSQWQTQIMDEIKKMTENAGLKMNIKYRACNVGTAYILDGFKSKLSFYFSFQNDTYSLQFYPEGVEPVGTCGFTHQNCIYDHYASYIDNHKFIQLFSFFENKMKTITTPLLPPRKRNTSKRNTSKKAI